LLICAREHRDATKPPPPLLLHETSPCGELLAPVLESVTVTVKLIVCPLVIERELGETLVADRERTWTV